MYTGTTIPSHIGPNNAAMGIGRKTLDTLETKRPMSQWFMSELMVMKQIHVLDGEAHNCYREKPSEHDEGELKGDACQVLASSDGK